MAAKARILAIDDQLYFRSYLDGLLSDEGYRVRTVDREDVAVELLESSGAVDLVIVDLSLPGNEGAEVVARLRRRWPEQAVIAVASAGDVRSVVAAMQSGAGDYLVKPTERDALLESVEYVLERRQSDIERARLVDENLELMGRISLFERALALLGPGCGESELAHGLLELLCAQGRARDGALWVERARVGSMELVATHGSVDAEAEPRVWLSGSEATDEALHAGRAVLDPPEGDRTERVYVPCIRDGRLLAIARLSRCTSGELTQRDADGCIKLAEIGALSLAHSLEREALRDSSFRDAHTGLPTRAFLEEVLRTELQKAHRYGRRVTLLRIDLEGLDAERDPKPVAGLVTALARTVRNTDILACEGPSRYWVLVTDADPLGGVVLKRRLAQRLEEVADAADLDVSAYFGVATYPLDGETCDALVGMAIRRAASGRESVAHELGIVASTPLAAISERLLARARQQPVEFVSQAAEVVIGELSCRPRDRGLLFLAPGDDHEGFLAMLTALGDAKAATDVFLATDGDTHPQGPVMTALGLPPNVSPHTTWIVRFGEAPPYALVAGPVADDGTRPVFHTSDPGLVEHMTFRLRSEIGFGLGA